MFSNAYAPRVCVAVLWSMTWCCMKKYALELESYITIQWVTMVMFLSGSMFLLKRDLISIRSAPHSLRLAMNFHTRVSPTVRLSVFFPLLSCALVCNVPQIALLNVTEDEVIPLNIPTVDIYPTHYVPHLTSAWRLHSYPNLRFFSVSHETNDPGICTHKKNATSLPLQWVNDFHSGQSFRCALWLISYKIYR